jgi:hypothetical protein
MRSTKLRATAVAAAAAAVLTFGAPAVAQASPSATAPATTSVSASAVKDGGDWWGGHRRFRHHRFFFNRFNRFGFGSPFFFNSGFGVVEVCFVNSWGGVLFCEIVR